MSEKAAPPHEAETAEEDPFAGFESSEFSEGEEVESAPADTSEESEADESDDGDDEGDDSKSSRSKGKQTAQERINELTRLRREAEREAEATKAQLEELKQRIPEPAPEPEAKKPEARTGKQEEEASENAPPSPDDFDYGELDPRYIRALASHEARQEFQKLVDDARKDAERRAAEQEQLEVQERFQKQVEEGSKKHEDFYEKVVIGAEKGEWPLSDHLGKLLVDSEVGDDIAYHLASHPEEAAQVYRQTPLEQARYFGKMEAKFSANQSAATGEEAVKTETTRTPKAPPPVTPARGSDGRFSPSASTDDFSAFEAHANQQ